MAHAEDDTCWTMVLAAAAGDAAARERFAGLYLDVVRAYLGARWRGSRLLARLDDAVQDVFLECFRAGGALSGLDREGAAAFRTFLHAVVRNVARRHEEGRGDLRHAQEDSRIVLDAMPAGDPGQEEVFDRAWALAMMARARERQRVLAERDGERGRRRLELLELRFTHGLPIREIARRFGADPEFLHAEARRARAEFRRALEAEVAFQGLRDPEAIEAECRRLLDLLGPRG
jgi:RNA polymerase sigma factor (sigma-70 family)